MNFEISFLIIIIKQLLCTAWRQIIQCRIYNK